MHKHPGLISIREYSYTLPNEKIATHPLPDRHSAKLLVFEEGQIKEGIYRDLAQYIPEDSLMIFNKTKVVPARLLFEKPTGGMIEVFCLEPADKYPDVTAAMDTTSSVQWKCLVGGASKWKPGQVLHKQVEKNGELVEVRAAFREKLQGSFSIDISWSPASLTFAEILFACGAVPLPPYIKRPAGENDKESYQTVYASSSGSVAAPTAGLHFTSEVFASLKKKNIDTEFLTLHVGAGTFMPVKSDTMEQHDMHSEWIEVERSLIEDLACRRNGKTVAVGTTSLRTLESIYLIGARIYNGMDPDPSLVLQVEQWEPYADQFKQVAAHDALNALLNWMKKNKKTVLVAKTRILIAPGYRFMIANGLVTNFHQPNSTLLLLVAAFAGNSWKDIYQYALENDFRFLSYGDGCLLWRRNEPTLS